MSASAECTRSGTGAKARDDSRNMCVLEMRDEGVVNRRRAGALTIVKLHVPVGSSARCSAFSHPDDAKVGGEHDA